MEPRQFDEWWALYRIEPWGDDWEQAGTVAAVVHNELISVNRLLTRGDPQSEPNQPANYIPGRMPDRKKRFLTNEEAQRASRLRAGV